MTARFWICIDRPVAAETIHAAGCGFCNDGRGMKGDRIAAKID